MFQGLWVCQRIMIVGVDTIGIAVSQFKQSLPKVIEKQRRNKLFIFFPPIRSLHFGTINICIIIILVCVCFTETIISSSYSNLKYSA